MRERLLELLDGICPADRAAMEDARTRWNSLAKPIGSLGFLEEAVVRAAGITGDARHVSLNRPALVVMCADHGVVREGVSQTGQEVTRIVAENFTRNQTSTSILCRRSGTDIFPVDIGMLGPSFPNGRPQPFVMLNRKVAEGSKNIVREAAMSMEECLKALLAGLFLVRDLKERGYGILAVGEMGIGNTTPSSAVGSVLTGLSPKEVTGKGAGLSEAAFEKKKAAVAAAVGRFYEAHPEYASYAWLAEPAEKPECAKRIFHVCALLAELGGFDLAGMAGVFLGGAVYRLPVVMEAVYYDNQPKNIARISKELPLFIVSGDKDPVGNMGKGVKKVFEQYKKAGIRHVSMKLYENDRHEILNELDREDVYQDIYQWMHTVMERSIRC